MAAPVLTMEHIRQDLARKPPPEPSTISADECHASLRDLALCLLFQQQLCLQKKISNYNFAGIDSVDERFVQALKSEHGSTIRALVEATTALSISTHEEGKWRGEDGPLMAVLWEEQDEVEEDGAAQENRGTKDRYLALLERHELLPVCISLPVSPPSSCYQSDTARTSSDESEHQSMRDIERDSLVVNGAPYKPGGVGGHMRVLSWLKHVVQTQLGSTGCPHALGEEVGTFIRHILRQINRTNSAGSAYDLLVRRLGVEGVVATVPDSKAAEPLEIDVDTGAFPLPASLPPSLPPSIPPSSPSEREVASGKAERAFGWGVRARLRTATSYVVYDEGLEAEWVKVRAEYAETVCLPLLMVPRRGETCKGGCGRGGGRASEVAGVRTPVSLGASVRLMRREDAVDGERGRD